MGVPRLHTRHHRSRTPASPGRTPRPHHTGAQDRQADRGTKLTLNPGLVFGNDTAIADVKYKLTSGAWARADLYQVTAFAAAYRTRSAAVVSFARSDHLTAAPDLLLGEIAIRSLKWRCSTGWDPDEAAARLAEDCRAWLDESAPESIVAV